MLVCAEKTRKKRKDLSPCTKEPFLFSRRRKKIVFELFTEKKKKLLQGKKEHIPLSHILLWSVRPRERGGGLTSSGAGSPSSLS